MLAAAEDFGADNDDERWSDAYHSTRQAAFPVHHIFEACTSGSMIHDTYVHRGTGGHPLCRVCKATAMSTHDSTAEE